MRTVKFKWHLTVDRDQDMEIETEVIVDDSDDGAQAGAEAMRFARRFIDGVVEAGNE